MAEDKLTERFAEIAKAAIYGGYFRVNNDFDIHIVEVEFYFHSEDDDISSIHDWAMYHRGSIVRKGDPLFFILLSPKKDTNR